ncbi:uncharacterized protein DNG_07472 [Cephalotrichum gorgonifer]|uniref:Uncharacterized protein n=1 Tax=Cephalotrichum gorgonifer TaxID=2041049 RepID=A0AAE8SY88_9PEZI|nr:uncharacterized protein DNG_07472 [Cephalotrichum gorgonifer]
MHPHLPALLIAVAGTSAALPAAAPDTRHLTSSPLIPAGLDNTPAPQSSHPYEDLSTGGTHKFDVGAAGRKDKPAATAFQDSSKDADKLETPRKKLHLPAIEAAHLPRRGETDDLKEDLGYGSGVPYGISPEEEELYEDIVTGEADKSKVAVFGLVPRPEAAPEAEKREEVGDSQDDPYSGQHPYEVHPNEEDLYEEIITGGADKFKGAAFGAVSSPERPEVEKREELDDDDFERDDDSEHDDDCQDDDEVDDWDDSDEDISYDGDQYHPYESHNTYEAHPEEEDLYEDIVTGGDDDEFEHTEKTDPSPKQKQ